MVFDLTIVCDALPAKGWIAASTKPALDHRPLDVPSWPACSTSIATGSGRVVGPHVDLVKEARYALTHPRTGTRPAATLVTASVVGLPGARALDGAARASCLGIY